MRQDVQLHSDNRCETTSIIQTPEIHHSSLDASDINQLTHSSGTVESLEFEIKPPVQTPIAGDRSGEQA